MAVNLKGNTQLHGRFVLFLITGIIFLPAQAIANTETTAPNIILIVADYMGYSDIAPYGAKDIKTPALSELAKQGVKFSNHYSAAPTCIPSRASLMSGLYPSKVLERINPDSGFGLRSENNILLNELKAAEYKTALIGKWHLGVEENFNPIDHGFDYFYGFHSWALGYYDHLTSDGEPGLFRNNELVTEEGYLTDLFTTEALKFIDNNANDPFFLYLSYNTALPPYQGPDVPKSEWSSGWDANEASRDDYIAMVESMDQGIQKVLKKLSDLQLEENTLIIFTYDHGGRHLVNSSPLFHGFATLWEGGIRVPLIIRWPNEVEAGGDITDPTIAMDITATMLDAAQRERALDGVSLVQGVTNNNEHNDRQLFWKYGRMTAVRQGSWKYVIDNHSQLLFNLDSDVGERKNLFSQYPGKVDILKKALTDWEQSLNTE